jgi:transcriptional regulator with XRE-family HTH domain
MRDLELGRLVRALRRRRGWRQEDCAVRARVHRSTWSNIERGRVGQMTVATLRQCLAVVDVTLVLLPGGDRAGFDRLLDEDHARLEAVWTRRFQLAGWQVWAERSFNHFGERGRVDLLCWHPATRTLAVVEIKTDLADSQQLLGVLDTKVRLGPVLAKELGLPAPGRVMPVLIFKESMTTRRRLGRLAPLFARFDLRGQAAMSWLQHPAAAGLGSGVLLFTDANADRVRELSPRRVRPPRGNSQAS